MRKSLTYIGMKKNTFEVIGEEFSTPKDVLIPVRCNCGKEYNISRNHFIKRCPETCINCRKAIIKESVDFNKNRLKDLYRHIKFRLNNPVGRNSNYIGITMDDTWEKDFEEFYNWSMSNGYKQGLSIDRKDNDKGYTPDNCRWVTTIVQSQNRRKTKNNTTGYKGVYKAKPRNGEVKYKNTYTNPYYTIIIYDGKRTTLSGFATAEEAYKAREDYVNQYYNGLVIL